MMADKQLKELYICYKRNTILFRKKVKKRNSSAFRFHCYKNRGLPAYGRGSPRVVMKPLASWWSYRSPVVKDARDSLYRL